MDLLIACAVFLLFAGVGGLLVHRSLDHVAVGNRLEQVTRPSEVIDSLARIGPRSRAASGLFNGLLPRLHLMRRLEQYMWQAGMYQGGYRALLLMGGLLAAGVVAWSWTRATTSKSSCASAEPFTPPRRSNVSAVERAQSEHNEDKNTKGSASAAR